MSDLSIPGVKSKYDTEKMIAELMKVERIPRDRAAERLKELETQRKIWVELNSRLVKLRDSARNLFSYKTPFNERIATSSDQGILTATASREAVEGVSSFVVKQVAQADRFISKNLPKDFKVPAGTYAFKVGDSAIELTFSGGTVKEFAEALNKKGKDLVRAQVIPVTSAENALVIESAKTGEKNRLTFDKAAIDLSLAIGMMERSSSTERKVSVSDASLRPLDVPVDKTKVRAVDGTVTLAPGAQARIDITPPASGAGLYLEYEIRVTALPSGSDATPTAPTGPAIPATGSMTFEGITVESDPSVVDLPAWKPPEKPPVVDDPNIVFLGSSKGSYAPLPATTATGEWVKVRVPLSDFPPDAAFIALKNRNTGKTAEIRGIRVFDPAAVDGLKPANAVSSSRDAIVVMDGVEIRRDSNTISDLLPGVTLNLVQASDKTVKLTVEPDRKAVKDAIIEFVGLYNRALADINVLTKTDPQVVSELSYLSPDEIKTAEERLGTMQGETMLSQIKNYAQTVMMNAYPTPLGRDLSLLSQIGISTDSRKVGSGGVDASRLRGYLEIDEAALDKALASNFESVKALFGSDSDGDMIVDKGLAYMLDQYIKAYVETGGLFATRLKTLDTQITSQKSMIATLDQQLLAKEEELKRKYGMMEGALGTMESTSTQIQNFGNTGNK